MPARRLANRRIDQIDANVVSWLRTYTPRKVTAGAAAITGWTVTWRYAGGQTVSQVWNATLTSSGSQVTARNVGYNGALGAGAGTEFGFLGSGTSEAPALTCTAA